MKDFLRTTIGKTLLFIICAISIGGFLGSSLAAVVYNDYGDAIFYKKSEREIFNDFVSRIVFDKVTQQAQSIIAYANAQLDPSYGDFAPQPTTSPERENPLKYLDDAALLRMVEESIISAAKTGNFENSEIDFKLSSSTGRELMASSGAASIEKWDYAYVLFIEKSEEGRLYFSGMREAKIGEMSEQGLYLKLQVKLREEALANSEVSFMKSLIHLAYSLRFAVYWIMVGSLLLAIFSFVLLMSVSGRRPGTEEIIPGALNFVPFDVLFVLTCAVPVPFVAGLDGVNLSGMRELTFALVFVFLGGAFGVAAFLGLSMSAAARIKQKTLIKKSLWFICLSLIWRVIRGAWRLVLSGFRNLPLVWKTALILFGISFVELIFIGIGLNAGGDIIILYFFLEKLIIIPAVLYLALMLKRLKKGGEALAEGDLSYVTDTKRMIGDLKKHGENLNSAAIGISKAIDARTKSERMKTELISNVSHDIKTPLTSIINYSMLISEEETENEKIREYTDVLRRQSERLSRLTDDIVEASKAQSGNLEVNLSPCDASVFITQAAGEYEDKLNASELTLITKKPEKELLIMADGRRMLRIFDNLMSNISKYAQGGTRVYLSLEEEKDEAVISFKNTSRESLDIDPSELMERFTRGDSARSSEGNGLGLAIAKSMAELQGGKLEISIDGDLFKAQLRFPLIKKS